MSATPTGIPFYDARAKPLSTIGQIQAGCYYQFYTTGTLSLTNVYSDGGLTTPMSQTPGTGQTTAASDGRLPVIYLNPATTYRYQLYTSGNVLLEDVDPYIPAVPSNGVLAVSATGISGLSPTQPGTFLDMTPDGNTATLTGTGFSGGAPTCTLYWRRIGTMVTVGMTALSGTSNATTFTLTGVPAAIIPPTVAQNSCICSATNNSIMCLGTIGVSTTSVWTMNISTGVGTAFSSSAWTASGTKGVTAISFAYVLV